MSPPISTPKKNAQQTRTVNRFLVQKNQNRSVKAALAAEGKVGLLLNVEEKNLEPLIKILPALKKPTISRLTEPGWYSISTIAEEKVVRELIPKLKKMGATGIVEFPLNKVLD